MKSNILASLFNELNVPSYHLLKTDFDQLKYEFRAGLVPDID
ncbi:hypothetical protein [Fulvivirga lutea]|nr:hypothetical protein [Fulvivirga lutea]